MYYSGMIGYIAGVVKALRAGHAVVLTGRIGYKIATTKAVLASFTLGGKAELWTHLAVKEDALDLYGFETEEELRLFELLLTVSGIGPKSALAILDITSPETLRSAVAAGKAEYLTKVSGIGRKTAEKIVLELREKIGIGSESAKAALKGDEEALEALTALGYSATEARDALRKVPSKIEKGSERLREALKILGGGKS